MNRIATFLCLAAALGIATAAEPLDSPRGNPPLSNYAVKLPIHGAALGVIAADITTSVNDGKYSNYVLSSWLSAVRNFSPSTTDAVDDVL
jgi:hypothetical protein